MAEVSQILVSSETPIYLEQSCLELILHAAPGTLYSLFILQYS